MELSGIASPLARDASVSQKDGIALARIAIASAQTVLANSAMAKDTDSHLALACAQRLLDGEDCKAELDNALLKALCDARKSGPCQPLYRLIALALSGAIQMRFGGPTIGVATKAAEELEYGICRTAPALIRQYAGNEAPKLLAKMVQEAQAFAASP